MKNQNELANLFILNQKMCSKNPLTAKMTANDVILISDKEKTFEFEFHFDPYKDDLNPVTIVHKEIPYDADVETLVDSNGVVKCLIHPLFSVGEEVCGSTEFIELTI